MSIDETGWNEIERRALAFEKVIESHCPELEHVETLKVPETKEQEAAWMVIALAQARANLHRNNSAIRSAVMWLAIGETQRALECLNRALLGL